MESNHHVPTNSNGERALNIQGALTPEEVNKPVISYHRRYPDGKYVPVILSPGYGFNPQDDELIVDYLNKEINKVEAPYICIPKVNVYHHTPEELAESHASLGKDEWHFFSPRDRKYLNGNRPNRAAGNGFWKATGADKKIYRDGKSVGSKKCLVFYQGKPKQSNKTTWIMHEYVADRPQRPRRPNGTDDMRLDDCVLCRIYKKSEYSPKEEKEAAASESGETAKPAQPIVQANLPTPPLNPQAIMQYGPQPWRNNLCGRLDFRPKSNPEEAQPIMPQLNLPTQQQNPQAIMQNSPQPWSSNNLGGQTDFCQERNPEEAKLVMREPNLSTPQWNPQATQYSTLQAGSHDLGGQLYFSMESIPEEANQFNIDNLGNSHETFGDSIPMDTVGNLTFPPVFQNGFSYDDIYHLPPMDSFDSIPPSLYNNDHPQIRSLIQGDELVFPKAGRTSGNAYNPREKS